MASLPVLKNDKITDAIWKLQGQSDEKLKYKYIGNWDGRPSASTLSEGDLIYITDIPIDGFIGSAWYALPNAYTYVPLSGGVYIGQSAIPTDASLSTSEQVLFSARWQAGQLVSGLPVLINMIASKNGNNDNATIRIRMGSVDPDVNPTANAVVAENSLLTSAYNQFRYEPEIQLLDDVTTRCFTRLGSAIGPVNFTLPSDVTVDDISLGGYISVSVQMSGTTNTFTLQNISCVQRGLG